MVIEAIFVNIDISK